MAHTLEDKNRRKVVLKTSSVGEVVPSYFEEAHPTLITFLEKYYDFLDSDGKYAFSSEIKNIATSRDASQTSEDNLNELVKEIGDGLQSSSFFHQPRLMVRLLGSFYRSKGSVVSAEGFFRGFFNEPVTIEYPKDQLFIVGESNIGFESQKFIQNYALYQIFSILVKVGISTTDYENLYKKFVHPAGWFFRGEVSSIGTVNNLVNFVASGDSIRPDPIDTAIKLFSDVTYDFFARDSSSETGTGFNEVTGLLDSAGDQVRVRLDQFISVYQDLTSSELENFYGSLAELLTPNSFTFDDSNRLGIIARPDFSMNLETMDNAMFTRYLSDSTI